MTNLLSEEEIFARLSVILQEALRIGPTEILPEARLFDNLGGNHWIYSTSDSVWMKRLILRQPTKN